MPDQLWLSAFHSFSNIRCLSFFSPSVGLSAYFPKKLQSLQYSGPSLRDTDEAAAETSSVIFPGSERELIPGKEPSKTIHMNICLAFQARFRRKVCGGWRGRGWAAGTALGRLSEGSWEGSGQHEGTKGTTLREQRRVRVSP